MITMPTKLTFFRKPGISHHNHHNPPNAIQVPEKPESHPSANTIHPLDQRESFPPLIDTLHTPVHNKSVFPQFASKEYRV